MVGLSFKQLRVNFIHDYSEFMFVAAQSLKSPFTSKRLLNIDFHFETVIMARFYKSSTENDDKHATSLKNISCMLTNMG